MNTNYEVQSGVFIELTKEQINKINEQLEKNKKPSMEERFLQLMSDVDISKPVMDFEEYGNRLFWFDVNDNWVCEYNLENGVFWIDYYRIWSVFENEYDLGYGDIQDFTRTMVEKHFKIKGVTPLRKTKYPSLRVEKHFKIKGVTPNLLVNH